MPTKTHGPAFLARLDTLEGGGPTAGVFGDLLDAQRAALALAGEYWNPQLDTPTVLAYSLPDGVLGAVWEHNGRIWQIVSGAPTSKYGMI